MCQINYSCALTFCTPLNQHKKTKRKPKNKYFCFHSPTQHFIKFIHVFMFRTSVDTEKGIWKRLNHLMSVFNDAWRYLDLCFMPASLRVLDIFLGNNKLLEEWKAKAEKGSKHAFRLFLNYFSCPPTKRDSIRCFFLTISIISSRFCRLQIEN